jgi:hypothetical protein
VRPDHPPRDHSLPIARSLSAISANSSRWSNSFERRVALYEEFATTVILRLEQLERERERGLSGLVAPLPPVECDEQVTTGTVICAVCRRDHHTEPGPELMTPDGGVVCWPCGRAGSPQLTALVLAAAADQAERAAVDVCEAATGFLLGLMRSRGNDERADVLQRRVLIIQALLRRSRRWRHTEPETWLHPLPGVDEELEHAS